MHVIEMVIQYSSDIAAIAAVFSVVLEVAPVKVNPWTWLLKCVGNRMNADIIKRLDDVEKQLKAQDAKIDNNEKDRIKYEILDFARSCRRKEQHTKEEFDHILDQYDKYEVILAKLEQPNGKVTNAMKYVSAVYLEVIADDNFSA